MKTCISLFITLFSLQAVALNLKDGTYISENCGKVEVSRFGDHPKYADGDVRVGYFATNDEAENGFLEVGYSIYSADFFEIKKVSGICMDGEINLKPELWRLSPTDIKISCGGPKAPAYDTLTLEADEAGELKSIEFVAKVAKFSLSEVLYLPFFQTTKVNLVCSGFVRQ